MLTIQEFSKLLQLLHTELSESKQQVENLQSQYQQLQVIYIGIYGNITYLHIYNKSLNLEKD